MAVLATLYEEKLLRIRHVNDDLRVFANDCVQAITNHDSSPRSQRKVWNALSVYQKVQTDATTLFEILGGKIAACRLSESPRCEFGHSVGLKLDVRDIGSQKQNHNFGDMRNGDSNFVNFQTYVSIKSSSSDAGEWRGMTVEVEDARNEAMAVLEPTTSPPMVITSRNDLEIPGAASELTIPVSVRCVTRTYSLVLH